MHYYDGNCTLSNTKDVDYLLIHDKITGRFIIEKIRFHSRLRHTTKKPNSIIKSNANLAPRIAMHDFKDLLDEELDRELDMMDE